LAPTRPLAEFIAEATEIIEGLGREVLALVEKRGQEPSPEHLNAIFRAAHSLKGLSGMFGVEELSHLAHRTEDALDALRLGRIPLDDALVDTLVETLDVLQAQLADASAGAPREQTRLHAEDLGHRLIHLAKGPAPDADDVIDQTGLDPSIRAVFTEYEEHRLRENVKRGVSVWKVRAVFSLEDFDQRLAQLTGWLKPLGEVVSTLPSSQPGDDSSIAFDLVFGSNRSDQEIAAAVQGLATVSPLVKRNEPAAALTPLPRPSQDEPLMRFSPPVDDGGAGARLAPAPLPDFSLRSLTQTVRVDIGRLDALLDSIGELLLIRSNIDRLAEAAHAGVSLTKLWGQELLRETRALDRKLEDLQKGVLDVRMVPLGQVFDKLTRLMRRLVRESGKETDFDVSGGDVELDKLIVEELSDPLMHLLRNALDHGIEKPDARRAKGKPARGVVRLRARQQGNHVIIAVGDDGAGMDELRIRQVAVERGLLTEARSLELDRRDLLNLVFLPGFSTRTDVSELSGRGVGLDVVKTNLARLSALIDLESKRGQGTTFTMTLPLTLAVIRALMVQVSGRTYAVPLNSVLEVVWVKSSELFTVEKREVIQLRGQTLPFIRLARLFRLPEMDRSQHFVVVVGLAQQRFGLAVDELVGQQDIVTKPLSGRLRRVPGISGATELGDRRAVLVLDVGALMEELLHPQATG
jgi:two-component system, chemotaxis family, sensor kinase CheA